MRKLLLLIEICLLAWLLTGSARYEARKEIPVNTPEFDWENYIYKCILGAQYVVDHVKDSSRHDHYFRLIADNLDLFNYMLKYPVFRNGEFMINILDIVDEYDLSAILKQKITWRDDLGKDERVGRRVLFEFNKSYPVILFPMLSKKELEPLFFEYLEMYWDEKS